MDNGFIVRANCLRIWAAWCVGREGISPISVSHWWNEWQKSSVLPGRMVDSVFGWRDKDKVIWETERNVKAQGKNNPSQ